MLSQPMLGGILLVPLDIITNASGVSPWRDFRLELKEAFIQSMKEALQWYKISSSYEGESENDSLFPGEQVNILIGFSENIRGNVVFGLSRSTASRIATLIGEPEEAESDDKGRDELGKVAKFVVELAIGKSQITNAVGLSPPMVITGDDIYAMISHKRTTRLSFLLDGEKVSVSYHIESGRPSSGRR